MLFSQQATLLGNHQAKKINSKTRKTETFIYFYTAEKRKKQPLSWKQKEQICLFSNRAKTKNFTCSFFRCGNDLPFWILNEATKGELEIDAIFERKTETISTCPNYYSFNKKIEKTFFPLMWTFGQICAGDEINWVNKMTDVFEHVHCCFLILLIEALFV